MGIRASKIPPTIELNDKTAIVTGANTGIGKEIARDFYDRGAKVILACRDVDKGNETAKEIKLKKSKHGHGRILVRHLDLAKLDSVREFAKNIIETERRVNILVNNAGTIGEKAKTSDGFDLVFQTNYLAPFLLTNLLLKKIIDSAPSRIINVASDAHSSGKINWKDLNLDKDDYRPWRAYCQSKLALVLFTKALAQQLKGNANVIACAVNPGTVRTALFRDSKDYFPTLLNAAVVCIKPFSKSPEKGAKTTIYCSTSDKVKNDNGLYYSDCKVKTPSRKARDQESIKKLWDKSTGMVKLEDAHRALKLNGW